jgi:hypothetical protein
MSSQSLVLERISKRPRLARLTPAPVTDLRPNKSSLSHTAGLVACIVPGQRFLEIRVPDMARDRCGGRARGVEGEPISRGTRLSPMCRSSVLAVA